MKKINELLRKNNIYGEKYRKVGKCLIVDHKDKSFVVKKNKTNIYEYLNYRNFDNYPNLIIDSGYEIMDYVDEIEIPNEQKMIDLINVVSALHRKTTYYKKISESNIEDLYEEIKKKIENIKVYYDTLMFNVESSIYMSPSYYLLARNISSVYNTIEYCIKNIDEWYNIIKNTDKIRVSIIHNNLSLDHFINNTLISWDNSKISLPVFDLYKLYLNSYNEYDWNELLELYSMNYPLKDEEIFLFKTLISIPLEFNITSIEIDNVKEINRKLNYLKTTYEFVSTKKVEKSI